MPFGAWCPLPLRLGPDPERGWGSPQQSRTAADLAAVSRTIPLAVLSYDAGAFSVLSYTAQYGSGAANAPTVQQIASGHWGIFWSDAYQSYDETYLGWKIRAATVTAQSVTGVVATVTYYPNPTYDLELYFTDLASGLPTDPVFTVAVYGDWIPRRQIGDYDGATDKIDSLTEGDSSYCCDWFVELQAMRGSAYSTSSGNVDAENFAIARQLGALSRAAEKLEANSMPGTSDEKLEAWIEILGIPVRLTDQRWQIRQRAEAKMRAAASNALPGDIDSAIQDLVGSAFVACHRYIGTALSSPPANTYWPVVNPGAASDSLGGGAWRSSRYYYWVEVTQPASANDGDFLRLMNIDLFELLDQRLPAHMTFSWATSDGFILDVSQLDFAAFGPDT